MSVQTVDRGRYYKDLGVAVASFMRNYPWQLTTKSSWIEAIRYQSVTKSMEMRLRPFRVGGRWPGTRVGGKGTYSWLTFPRFLFMSWRAAASPGGFFNSTIRSQFVTKPKREGDFRPVLIRQAARIKVQRARKLGHRMDHPKF